MLFLHVHPKMYKYAQFGLGLFVNVMTQSVLMNQTCDRTILNVDRLHLRDTLTHAKCHLMSGSLTL